MFQTLKESFIKAEGSGLAYGLQNLEFQICSRWPPAVGVREMLHLCVCVCVCVPPCGWQNYSLLLVMVRCRPDVNSRILVLELATQDK